MRILPLLFLLITTQFLTAEEPIPITLVPNLFSESKMNNAKNQLDNIFNAWKAKTKHREHFLGTELVQADIIFLKNSDCFNFIELEFQEDHQLTNQSKTNIQKALKVRKSLFGSFQQDLKPVAINIFSSAIERFAEELKLVGNHYIRCDIRGFFVNLPQSKMGSPLTHNLGWHWDYCSHSSMVTEIFSDFDPAGILFARNINPPPLPDCRKPASHYDAHPNEETFLAVDHIENSGIIFSAEQGGIIHVPIPPSVPQNQYGLLMRAVLQVVLLDKEWLEMSKLN